MDYGCQNSTIRSVLAVNESLLYTYPYVMSKVRYRHWQISSKPINLKDESSK